MVAEWGELTKNDNEQLREFISNNLSNINPNYKTLVKMLQELNKKVHKELSEGLKRRVKEAYYPGVSDRQLVARRP